MFNSLISNPFSIEQQFNLFLEKMYKTPEKLVDAQRIQLQHAFFAGWSQLMITIKHSISELPDEKAIAILEDMDKQIMSYFETWATEQS